MADQIVLNIPDEISTRAREIASTTNVPVETVLLNHLETLGETLPPALQRELDALAFLSDDALWAIFGEQMPEDVEGRAHALMDKNTDGTITRAEYAELTEFVSRADRMMLRKAEAQVLLQQRGYSDLQRRSA